MYNERVVLLACGSYNPVTNMHLRMFENARDHLNRLNYNVVGGIISPVHDAYPKDSLVSATHRKAMLAVALKTSDWIQLSTWESEQSGWTTTCNVLSHHLAKVHEFIPVNNRKSRNINLNDENERITVKLICGGDFLASFNVPDLWSAHDVEHILKVHGIICGTRHGYNIPEIIDQNDILFKYSNRIIVVPEFIENTISSTRIRKACSRGLSIKYLVPDGVEQYIKSQGLYLTSKPIKQSNLNNNPATTSAVQSKCRQNNSSGVKKQKEVIRKTRRKNAARVKNTRK